MLLEMVLPGIGEVWKNRYCASARLFYRRCLDPARARRLGRKRLGEILRRRAWGKFSEETLGKLWTVIENASQRLTKQGDPMLRSWLYVGAELVRHYDPELQAFYLRLTRRGLHHKAAICAVATKLLRRIYAVLRDGVDYRVLASEKIHNTEKPVRMSVHEVAQALLKDHADSASPREGYALQPVGASDTLVPAAGEV
jgi:hypothetical protein